MRNTELRKEWETRVAEFKASGQSTMEWCASNNIKINQLRYWLRKLKSTDASSVPSANQWLSVEISEVPSGNGNTLTVKVGKAIIEIKSGFDPVLLADVVKTLAAI
ncbi:MAG: IS66 family insertion sequence element accessory protein TnpA [Bacillota bacterium]